MFKIIFAVFTTLIYASKKSIRQPESRALRTFTGRYSGKSFGKYGEFRMQVRFNRRTLKVEFELQMPNQSWFGLTLGRASMINSDILLFRANGVRSAAYDMYSKGYFMPFIDPVQNVVSLWY